MKKFLKALIMIAGSILLIWIGNAIVESAEAAWTDVSITSDGTTWFTVTESDNPDVRAGYLCDAKELRCSPFVSYAALDCNIGQEIAMLVSVQGGPFYGSGPVKATCIDSGETGAVLVMNRWDDPRSIILEKAMVTGASLTMVTIMASGKIYIGIISLAGSKKAIEGVLRASEQSSGTDLKPQQESLHPSESGEF